MRPITLADANSHSDANDATTLTSANAYTDAAIVSIPGFVEIDPYLALRKI